MGPGIRSVEGAGSARTLTVEGAEHAASAEKMTRTERLTTTDLKKSSQSVERHVTIATNAR
jgi:hypothetical protein